MLQAMRDEVIVIPMFEQKVGLIELLPGKNEYNQYHGKVYGVVQSVGPKFFLRFERECLKPGDKIIFQRHEGKRIMFNNTLYLSLKPKWVLAKLIQ